MFFHLKPTAFQHQRNVGKMSFVVFLLTVILVSVGLPGASAQNIAVLIPPSQDIPSSLFGMSFNHLLYPYEKNPLTTWPSVRIPEWRLWDLRANWPDIEPAKGQWRFDYLDKYMELAQEHHTGVMLTLGFTPAWISARPQERVGNNPGWAAEPKDIGEWRIFVQTIATRYKGRIHIYEIWNEPNLDKNFWTGSVEQLVELVHVAHDVIKSIDPTAIIVSPSVTSEYGIPWFSKFLSKGVGQYVDVIGYHFYVKSQPPETMIPLVEKVKKVMLENGLEHKPLWDTETGWGWGQTPPPITEEVGAGYLARSYILLWAAGVQRFYWYAWDNPFDFIAGRRIADNNITPAGEAFGTIQKWLVGAQMGKCEQDANHTWACELNRNGNLQWIVWNPDSTRPFTAPSAWQVKSITPLLGSLRPLGGSTFDVGPIPILVNALGQ